MRHLHTTAVISLPALFPACSACRECPVIKTRQRAIYARPAGQWFQACNRHVPGIALKRLPTDHPLVQMATRIDAHEVVAL